MNTPKKSLCVNEHDLGGQLDPNPGPWGVIRVFLKILHPTKLGRLQQTNFQWAIG